MGNDYAEALRRDLAAHVRHEMKMDERIKTQARLARAAGVGQSSISRILNKKSGVTLELLAAVAQACNVMAYRLLLPIFDAPTPPESPDSEAQRLVGRIARVSKKHAGGKNETTEPGAAHGHRDSPKPRVRKKRSTPHKT